MFSSKWVKIFAVDAILQYLDGKNAINGMYRDTNFFPIFSQHAEFSFLLKERVCPLVIKLFSPSLKYRQGLQQQTSPTAAEKPYFPIVMRLLRIVYVLIKSYYSLLVCVFGDLSRLRKWILKPKEKKEKKIYSEAILCKMATTDWSMVYLRVS